MAIDARADKQPGNAYSLSRPHQFWHLIARQIEDRDYAPRSAYHLHSSGSFGLWGLNLQYGI